MAKRVIQQIEEAADYYGPELYSKLSFYSNFTPSQDNLSLDFIPVTGVKPNSKMFIVGLIPPAANISGRLLDRSASVASVLGAPEDLGVTSAAAPSGPTISEPASGSGKRYGASYTKQDASFWDAYLKMVKRLGADPYAIAAVMQRESGINPKAKNIARDKNGKVILDSKGNPVILAQGINQLSRAGLPAGKAGDAEWENVANLSAEEQLKYVEKTFSGRAKGKTATQMYSVNLGGYHDTNPDGSSYASIEAQNRWLAAHPEDNVKEPWGNPKVIHPEDNGRFRRSANQQSCYNGNPAFQTGPNGETGPRGVPGGVIMRDALGDYMTGLPTPAVRAEIDAALARAGGNYTPPAPPAPKAENTNGEWVDKGSANASKSKSDNSKTAGKELAKRQAELGAKFSSAQKAEIKATTIAIQQMRDTPPLRLLVNPATFKVSSEKVIADGNWTRNGPIIEHWGEGQDKLEASGKVAGFFAIDANSPNPDAEGEGPGLTRVARNFSASYHNLLSLWLLYRNNAGIYTKSLDGTELARLSMVGSIYIYYDDIMYVGSFDSFNLTEADDKPYTLEYNFQFTVRATFLLDRPDNTKGKAQQTNALTSGDPSIDEFNRTVEESNARIPMPDRPVGPDQLNNPSGWLGGLSAGASRGEDLAIDPSVSAATKTSPELAKLRRSQLIE